MTDTITIDKLANEDIEECINLVNSAYRGESSKKGWTTEADLLDGIRTDQKSLRAQLDTPGAIMLIARDGHNRMAGCVYLLQQGNQLYLGMLTVAPDIQARGIGKQLLLAAEKYSVEVNCTAVIMTVIDIRYELIEWYKRKGYRETGQTKPFPSHPSFGIPKQPLRFVVLEKQLPDILVNSAL
ncbi:MAG: GNAT family N-acetyltransferase [Ferruginibacter sp.]